MSVTLNYWGGPAAAYRADMRGRSDPFGPSDDGWLACGNALSLASRADDRASRQYLLEALGHAIDVLGDERITEYVERQWLGHRSYIESLVVLVESMLEAGATHLAGVMLDDLLATVRDVSVVERGRLLALRARVEWKLDHLDDAIERYEYIASLAEHDPTGELETRAEIGMIPISQLRGNLPELRLHARRAMELAERHGFRDLARLAYQAMIVVLTKDGAYDDALVAGWRFVQLSRGNAALEGEALGHVGQLLFDAGNLDLARASFAAALTFRAPARVLLAALGGLSLTSARLGDEATVEWSMREIWNAQHSPVPHYELADALLECAVALAMLGRADESDRYRAAGERIANESGFHELVFRAENLDRQRQVRGASRPASLTPQAAEVARELAALQPEQLPHHLVFDAAPA